LHFLTACGGGSNTSNTSGSNTSNTSSDSGSNSQSGGSNQSQEPEKVELRMMWWGSQTRHENTLKVIDLFQQKYPHITISPEYLGADGYWDKLNTLVAGGNAPDLIQLGNNYVDYVNRGAIMDITDLVGDVIDLSNFDESIANTGFVNGKQYGINLGSNSLGILYNKTLIESVGMELPKEGWTWEEMEEYSKQLVEKLGPGKYAFADQSGFTHYVGHFVRQKGKALYTGDAIGFDEQDAAEWFAMWERFREQGLIPTAELTASYTETSPDNSLLIEGKVAMVVIWSNQITGFQNATQDMLDMVPLPQGGEHLGMWVQPSQFLSINAKSAHPQEAAMFISFFVNDPEATAILGSDRGIPGSAVVREALKVGADEVTMRMYDYFSTAVNYTREMDIEMPNINEWDQALKNASQLVAFKAGSIEQAAKETVDAAKYAISH
jgi:multiple sugar transport system substrate-binding protein